MRDVPESRRGSHAEPERSLDDPIGRDLEALASRSQRNVRPLTDTVQRLAGERPKRPWEERLMASFKLLGARPRLAVVGAVAALALALLVIPVSYQRVVGHDVTLQLAGAGIDQSTIRGIATEFKTALNGGPVRVEAQADGAAATFILSSRVPMRSGRSAEAIAQAFAHTLTGKGYTAEAAVTAVREKVSSNVYAMVAENVIRISVDGKSSAEVETAIAEQLAAAGIPNAQVSVTMDGDGNKMEIQVRAEHEGPCDGTATPPEIVLTAGGEDLGGTGEAARIKICKTMTDEGARLVLDVEQAGRIATVTVNNPETLSDAELSAEVQRQLTALGITDLSVSAQDGILKCFDANALLEKSAPGATPGGTEKTTFGKVKTKYNP